ncbi:aminopeptidase P family protein [Pseudoroseomonas wenyumeiae]|uniref:Aminopeptidase P family protein n=1 Tax=Teichococcus wenyumeiae TaxID=2478470 RepID=A0ABX9VBT7_9PROT|nr:Xaa-Pro peptidase family protein [Pseudoroseomonas wenyumeiae]RMI15234.1 aminopeptidase P family protein [Pseudoroseomonas wenyumeiae]
MTEDVQFSAKEFADRLAALRHRMEGDGAEVALLDEIEPMSWISGYGSSLNRWRCVVVPLDAEPFFLIRALDAAPCRQRTWIQDIRTYRDWEDPMPVLAAALATRGLAAARIGLDFNSYAMSLSRFAQLKAALPAATIVDMGPVVNELRLIKSPAEIAILRRSAAVADESLRRAAAACIPGGSQRDAARIAVSSYVELGADPSPVGPISAGTGWDFLHGHLSDTPLSPGDVVHIELVPRIAGYSARIMRCVTLGKPAPALAAAAETLIALQDEQIAALRPGARAHDVDAILRDGVIRSGLRPGYDNITGYTLGLYAPQTPRTSDFTRILHPGADWTVEAGMVFHIYASAGGVSISETVLVGEDGPELLTRFPRGLIINENGN